MQRVGTVLLAVLTVIVLAGAVYVIVDNGDPTTRSAAPDSAVPTLTVTDTPSTTVESPSSSASASSPSSSGSAGSSGPSQAAGSGRVVAFLGDDWTAGDGASTASARFSTLLSARLDVREKNFGVAGTGYARTAAAGGNYASRASAVIAAGPDVVVVTGGRNDVQLDPATVGADARTLFSALTAGLPRATILVIAPFWGDSDKPAQLDAVAAAVQRAADRAGVTYVDLADPINGHPGYMADDADPDDDGYAAIAAALRADPTITSAIGTR